MHNRTKIYQTFPWWVWAFLCWVFRFYAWLFGVGFLLGIAAALFLHDTSWVLLIQTPLLCVFCAVLSIFFQIAWELRREDEP